MLATATVTLPTTSIRHRDIPRRNVYVRREGEGPNDLAALPNKFPFQYMLLDGILKLGDFGVKTRSGNNVEPGLHLLYSSSNKMTPSLESYPQFRNSETYPSPALVGVGDLKEVRTLTDEEAEQLFFQFNNSTDLEEIESRHRYVYPLPYGLFFQGLRKFEKPVDFKASGGPVSEVRVPRSQRKVIGELKEQLQQVGLTLEHIKLFERPKTKAV